MTAREKWERGYVVARVWWCGDDECDCVQPRIERVSPNHVAGYPWIHRETLWEGTFVTLGGTWGGWPEGVTHESLVEELREATNRYPDARWLVADE